MSALPTSATSTSRVLSGDELDDLVEHAREMSFQGLVAFLERLVPAGAPEIGQLGPVSEERIRFQHDVRFVFHSGDVSGLRVRPTRDGPLFEVETAFLGVVGTVSPLATFLTEELLRGEDDPRMRFYDLFHHRLVSLFVRAARRSVPGAALTRGGHDSTSQRLLSLAGLPPSPRPDLAATRAAPAFPSLAALPHLRLFAQRPGSRAAILAAFALVCPELEVHTVTLPPREIRLDVDTQTSLGVKNAALGEIVLGGVLVGQPGLLRLGVGPAETPALRAVLPGGTLHAPLTRTLDHAAGGLVDVELDVAVAKGHEPSLVLGETVLGDAAMLSGGEPGVEAHVRVTFPSGDAPASVSWSAVVAPHRAAASPLYPRATAAPTT